ncbi:sigma factor [Mycoplasma crocodyli]|uniref:Uncharacterized protein n=1 Tax=Mycoplasma crocodyli (strain ATCC 51981 / MP145) TaxID=512564 RepID=D5E621_MYCCM|nr:sigma factor [Mycoplasma crocodyli]ADE19977.1 hypothetical protein MCRO_0597 [Mycoplasma crocodyli MP145]
MLKRDIKNMNDEVVQYFNLTFYKNISDQKLLMIYIRKFEQVISYWTRVKFNYLYCDEAKADDVRQVIYANLIKTVDNFDSKLGIPFENYFFNSLKYQILNEYNKTNTSQYKFENSLTWYAEDTIENISVTSGEDDRTLLELLSKYDTCNFINKLSKSEINTLKNINVNKNKMFFSSFRINSILSDIKNKYSAFYTQKN